MLENTKRFLEELVSFNERELFIHRYGLENFLYNARHTLTGMMPKDGPIDPAVTKGALFAVCLLLVIACCLQEDIRRRAIDICVIIILVQTNAVDYSLAIFIPILYMFIKDDEVLKPENVLWVALLLLMILPYPTRMLNGSDTEKELFHACMVQLALIVVPILEVVCIGYRIIRRRTADASDSTL